MLVVCALVAAALVARPWRAVGLPQAGRVDVERAAIAALADERRLLLAELRELDDDAAAGRIASEDRQAGRRALAPRLRAVVEALRGRGVDARGRDAAGIDARASDS